METIKMNNTKLTTAIASNFSSETVEGSINLSITKPEENLPGYVKHEEAYVKGAAYRSDLVGGLSNLVATQAKDAFVDDEQKNVDTIVASMNFGGTDIHATAHRTFGEGDDAISNHVVIGVEDDFTEIVNEAVAGIFDDK